MEMRVMGIPCTEKDLVARAIHKILCGCGSKRCESWPRMFAAADEAIRIAKPKSARFHANGEET